MKYINKYRFVNEAHNVNVEYLKDCFQGLGLPMIPRVDDHIQSYEDFKKAKYRFEYLSLIHI